MILSKAGHGAEVQFNYKDLECHFNQPLLDKKVRRAVEWQPVLLQWTSAVWTFPLVPVGIFPSFHGISGMQENTGFSFCSCQVSRFGKMKDFIPINGLLSFELPVQMIISTQVIFSFFIGKDILELEKETHIL